MYQPPLRGRPVLAGKKVLLIDRCQTTCEVRASVLRSHGVEVHAAADLSGARFLWHPNVYQLIMLDVRRYSPGDADAFIFLCDGRIVFGDEGAALRERVGNTLPGTPKIVVNLEGVEYIDSGGLGILVGLLVSARNRGGELKLVSPNHRIKELLRRTSLDNIFRVYGNNEEAVAAFRKQVA